MSLSLSLPARCMKLIHVIACNENDAIITLKILGTIYSKKRVAREKQELGIFVPLLSAISVSSF